MSRRCAMPRRPKATPSPLTSFCSQASTSVLQREVRPRQAAPISTRRTSRKLMSAAHVADRNHPLDPFLSPSSIAIIGASRDPLKIPGLLLAFLRKNQFSGLIFPVNPKYPDIDGL